MEIFKQFGINPLLLAAQIVNFFLLLFILKRFLYKPILKVLDERKKKIEESLKNAEEIEKRLLETEEEKEKVIGKASGEAQKLLDETKKELELMKEEMTQNAKTQAEMIIQKAKEAAQSEGVRIEQQIMIKMSDIVAAGMEKVAGKTLKKEQKEIIEREIKNLS
jgi:F-type H+-transporting ATPase subunit b